MTWQVPLSPHPPPAGSSVATVTDAFVTPFQRGTRRAQPGDTPRWMTGSVHDAAGHLVVEAQRSWHGDMNAPRAVDPDRVDVPAECRRLSGRWIYAGHWTQQFGHFMVEVLTNLWPDPVEADVSGILVHRSFRGPIPHRTGAWGALRVPELTEWQRDLLGLAGYGGLKVRVVRARPVRVDELVVPGRPVLLKSWAQEPAVALWRRVAAAAGPPDETGGNVFLSRAHHHQGASGNKAKVRTSPEWEGLVEARFVEAGFRIVHPEELPVSRQIGVVTGADVVAGFTGSALHLTAFAPGGTKVVELGDQRSPDDATATQTMIAAARGHEMTFVPYQDTGALDDLLRRAT